MRLSVLVCLCMCVCAAHPLEEADVQDPDHFLNSFVIQTESAHIAKRVARDNGFVLLEKLPHLDYYHLSHPAVTGRSKRSAEDYVSRLAKDPRVKFVEQQITLKRVKRSHVLHDKQLEFPLEDIQDNSKYFRVQSEFDTRGDLSRFNDEHFSDQWYLHNIEQTGGKRDIDLNVQPAWDSGFTGRGVVVTTLDDGVDHMHPDLAPNYEKRASADMNDVSDVYNDPTPDKSKSSNSHGTRCAGEIAAVAGNGICGVGVAYECKIGGIRILDGKITDRLEAHALLYANQIIDIYSASWGPHDDGKTMEAPKKVTKDALRMGVLKGRQGKGSIFIWATGNGGGYGDTCGADGYVSSIESISIQSLTDKGRLPFFGEKCCSTMASVPTGGERTKDEEREARLKIKVVTTDINGGCVENFEGTSSAAPLGAGCTALVLQANSDLTWRDVQHIVARGARIASSKDEAWIINGAGYHVNINFGFGMMDCARMVELAQSWVNKPEQHTCKTDTQDVNRDVPNSGCHKLTHHMDGCHGDSTRMITHLEHVELHMVVTAERRGDMEIFLTSPSGTRSPMLIQRPMDKIKTTIDFTFMTVHNWMEDPVGDWTIEACHKPSEQSTDADIQGFFKSWSMTIYGYHEEKKIEDKESSEKEESIGKENIREKRQSRVLETDELEEIMDREFKRSRSPSLKRAQETDFESKKRTKQDLYVDTVKDLMDEFGSKFDKKSLKTNYENERNSRLDKSDVDEVKESGGFIDSFVRSEGYQTELTGDQTEEKRGQTEQADNNDKDKEVEELKRKVLDLILDMDNEEEAVEYLRNYLDVVQSD